MKMLRLFAIVLISFLLIASWTVMVSATTHNTPTIDGIISIATDDWDSDENMGGSGGTSGRDLYVTWDENNLYVGVTGANDGTVEIFIDYADGGQQGNRPAGTNSFPISSSGGYEYAWRIIHTGDEAVWFDGTGTSWTGPFSQPGESLRNTDLEVRIPFTALIGYTPGNRISLLVLSAAGVNPANTNYPQYFWPNVSGNQISPTKSFSQGFVFANAGDANISPNAAPTAVTLHSFTANNPANKGIVVGSTILLFGISFYILRRRDTK